MLYKLSHYHFKFWHWVANLRRTIALWLCPQLNLLLKHQRFQRENDVYLYKQWQKDARGKEKAIRRLQREKKALLKKLDEQI